MPRGPGLVDAFVELADTLVVGFDVVEFMHALSGRCMELLGAQAAGLMLADQRGSLRVIATSSEQARLLELFELETEEGPCLLCFRTGATVGDSDLSRDDPRWPRLAARAREAGFQSGHALPMRLRDEIVGVLNLCYASPGPLSDHDARIGQALADIATIGLLQERAIRQRQVLAEQLQSALTSRVLIEQAKGVLAERLQITPDVAFALLRAHARRYNRQLTQLANEVIAGSTEISSADG